MKQDGPIKRLLVTIIALAMLVAACGDGDSSSDTTEGNGTDATTTTRGEGTTGGNDEGSDDGDSGGDVYGGTAVTALATNPQHLIRSLSSDIAIALAGLPMQESLVAVDGSGEPIPTLAESWDISEDGLTYTFHLRENATWHDGEPFTAHDVEFTFNEILPLAPTGSQLLDVFDSVEVIDDHTVDINLTVPFAPFITALEPLNITILPAHVYEGTDILNNPANLAPVGTGPFKFENWEVGESITLVRNDDYWAEDKPYLDRLIFQVVPDAATRIAALQSGEIDFADSGGLPLADIQPLLDDPELDAVWSDIQVGVTVMHYNVDRSPFGEPEVRRALFQALNRELMNEGGFSGLVEPGTSAIPPGIEWAYNPDVDYMEMYPYDPEAAEVALDEAGYPRDENGVRFSLEFKYRPDISGLDAIAEILRANWGEIGVEVELAPRERAVWIDEVYINHDFDVTMVSLATRLDPLLGIQRAYVCEDNPEATFTNPTGYCNEDLDELFLQAARTPVQAERAEFYYEAQEVIAEELPTAVVLTTGGYDVINAAFRNTEAFFDTASDAFRWSELQGPAE